MEPLLKVTNLTKQLDAFSLKDISFSLEPGYIMGIIGLNGSGKTSLIRTITKLYQADSGEVLINGASVYEQEAKAKSVLGTVLDEDFFEPFLSPEENAALFGAFYPDFSLETFRELCHRFEIPLSEKVKNLSHGIRTRMQFAFAVSHQAQLYLMDEPAGGLDPYFRKSLIGCMQELVESGERSVIFSTHITEDLDQVADYILMIHDGEMRFCLDKEELLSQFRLFRGTREEIQSLPKDWIAGYQHDQYHSEALLFLTEENKKQLTQTLVPKLADILYYLERGDSHEEAHAAHHS